MEPMRVLQRFSSFNEGVQSHEYASRVQVAFAVLVVIGAYLHVCVRRLAPGLVSLFSIIPVLLVNTYLPLMFSSRAELVTRVVSKQQRTLCWQLWPGCNSGSCGGSLHSQLWCISAPLCMLFLLLLLSNSQ